MKPYDLNLLRALDALLSTGSVTSAAERMHLSTPAMSHTLARIREVFDDPILVRAGRQLAPTPRALALAEPVRALLAEAHALRVGDHDGWVHDARRFVIRAPEGYSVVYGAMIANALTGQMANASVQLLPSGYQDPTALQEGRIDIDVSPQPGQAATPHGFALARQRLLGIARDRHPIFDAPMTAERWAGASHVDVMLTPNESLPIDEALAKRKLKRTLTLIVPHAYAAMVAVARSDLVGRAPEGMALSMGPNLGLRAFELPVAVPQAPMRVAWHPRHQNDPAHRWLRERLRSILSDPAQQPPPVSTADVWRDAGLHRQPAPPRRSDRRR